MARFILSKKKMLEQYNSVKNLCDTVSYSSKTNQDLTPLLERDTECMFSVHLEQELKHITEFSRVIFLAQGWTQEYIGTLVMRGIRWFIVDNEEDLETLIEFLNVGGIEKNSNQGVKINLLLRLKLKELSIRTERYFVFGMRSGVIKERLVELKSNKYIGKLGIHFHRKTQNMSEWNIKHELSSIFDEKDFESIDVVNIGGGLPVEYSNTNVDVFNGIVQKLDEFRIWLQKKGCEFFIEPGRYIAAPSCKLETNIISIHENNIIVDASVYNSDMDALIVPVKLIIEDELQKGEGEGYVVKGITPCSLDIFRYRVYLNNPGKGDKIVFLNAGAYNFTTNFCDLEKIKTEIVDDF